MAHYKVILTLAFVFSASGLLLNSTPELREYEDCPIPYHNVGGRCLYFNNMGFGTWQYMREACYSIYGEIVKIDSPNFFFDIVQFLQNQSFAEEIYWIGATDVATEGVWLWSDNSTVQMGTPFWGTKDSYGTTQEPDGNDRYNCAAIDKSRFYYFADYRCDDEAFSVICEYAGQGKI
ncbi:galactose-specific lectin nattectin-like [Macrobrachium rosenbergii]|uniref:galactose-specific lectin nattectin-like n=1 Tax=Macrobrachium rosenbergii TaxID=79674 RepID=UPI0034D4F79E